MLTGADEPPRRFGGKEAADQDRSGPDPLKSKWDSVSPLGVPSENGTKDTGSDELTDHPTEINVGGKIGSESDRAYFCGVGGGEGLEDTPRDSAAFVSGNQERVGEGSCSPLEDLADEEGLDVVCEEWDKDAANHHRQLRRSPSMADTGGKKQP